MRRWIRGTIAALTLCAGTLAAAQPYPSKPVRVVVPFGPGSGSDIIGRVVADELRQAFDQSFVVDNRPGASAQIAAELVAKSPPDGYTLMITTNTVQSANPFLFRRLNYDPIRDFTSVSTVMTLPYLLLVEPNSPFRSVKELVDFAKANPGKLTYGFGNSTSQVAGASFERAAGIRATAVAYKSLPPALTDLAGGQLNFVFSDIGASTALLKAGKVRPLAFTLDRRFGAMPELPTVAETPGLAGFEVISWVGVIGPAGMPADVTERLSAALRRILAKPEVKAKLADLHGDVAGSTPAEMDRFVAQQLESWRAKIRDAGIQPE
jgi:tripartite-type tricarboxylate transporter receptor subunit TctC